MKRLRSGVDYFVSSDGNELVIFPAYGNYSYTISKPFDLARKLMDQLSCPCDFEELSESITFQSNGAYQRKDVDSFLQFLTKEGLVVDINRNTMLSQDEQIRFERQTAYFEQSSSYPDDVDALQSRLLHKDSGLWWRWRSYCRAPGSKWNRFLAAS